MKYNFRYSCLTKHDLSIEITEVYSFGEDVARYVKISLQLF